MFYIKISKKNQKKHLLEMILFRFYNFDIEKNEK